MKNWLLRRYTYTYSTAETISVMLIAMINFLLVFPIFILVYGRALDHWIGIPDYKFQPINWFIFLVLTSLGLLIALWAIVIRFTNHRDTRIPLNLAFQLITQRPYTFCRNPVALGISMTYLGIGMLFGSIGAILVSCLFLILWLIYFRHVEERFLTAHFGDEYEAYRRRTPLLFPLFLQN